MPGIPPRNFKKKTKLSKTGCFQKTEDKINDYLNPLKVLREERGISQKSLAVKLGFAKTHIARLESRPMAHLSLADLDKICQGLEYRLEEAIQRFYTKIKGSIMERSKLNMPVYIINYDEGVKICAMVRPGKPYFAGVLKIQPRKEWTKEKVIKRKEIFIHVLEGNLLLKINGKEHLFKEDENLTLSMPSSYEIYNPHQFKELVAMIYATPNPPDSSNGSQIIS